MGRGWREGGGQGDSGGGTGLGGLGSPFFHLSSVLSTKNDHLLLGEVDCHRGSRGHTSGESVRWESTSVVDDIVRVEALELLPRRADEHVTHEQGMVCAGTDNADADSVARIPAGVSINDIDAIPGVQVIDSAFSVDLPDLMYKVSIHHELLSVYSIVVDML